MTTAYKSACHPTNFFNTVVDPTACTTPYYTCERDTFFGFGGVRHDCAPATATEGAAAATEAPSPPPGYKAVQASRVFADGRCTGPPPEVHVQRLGGKASHADAVAKCAAVGGRLCTRAEAWEGCAGQYSGRNLDKSPIWTSDACEAGSSHLAVLGMGRDPSRTTAEPSCVPDTELRHVQCCRDASAAAVV